ncbi:MAG: malto-oligosyltrehalose synthase [Chloroflexota bacterium]|nr:MAG: malto-oligosyltrehalose synthase [Chloroflexota bacterium]
MVAAAIKQAAAGPRIPCATYRLQFNRDFTFRDAQDLVPYLDDLGISDVYASPIFKPRSNSSHGYDICDHSQFNPAVGSMEEFESFSAVLHGREMGLLLDVVPNHMGIGDCSNVWWMDVLENGPSSSFASYFDIDWHPVRPELQNKVLLPILGDQYGKELSRGAFRLTYEDGAFFVRYYDIRLPVAPRSYRSILGHQLPTLAQALGESHEHVRELRSILTALSYLPLQTERDPEKIAERNREKELIKRRIANLHSNSAYVRAAVDMAVQAFNGTPRDPRSFDLLHDLLEAQAYRPAFWRVAVEEINYRRFFDVNELAAIRVELPQVFESTHELAFRLLEEGKVTGLRIDHPDGLRSPHDYFRLLQENFLLRRVRIQLGPTASQVDMGEAISRWFIEQSSRAQSNSPFWPLYVVAEKILCEKEALPSDWMLHGNTGYDFLNAVNDLFVDGSNCGAFDKIYGRFIGSEAVFSNLVNSTKKMIMLVSLVGEINALGHQLERVAEKNRLYRDFTLNSLVFAIREVIAALPVYRTYISGTNSVGQQDQSQIETAVAEAKKRNPRTATPIFDFIQDTLLLRNIGDFAEEDRGALVDLVMKFQQVTGPIMAKGVEDTAFYVYNRLVSLNEVGGHPERFGGSVSVFHHENTKRQRDWPHSLLATSTHDTKRSEDVRSRLNVLSEIPKEWGAALTRWSRLNGSKKTTVDGELAPDRNDEYLLYQTLLGTWPDGTPTAEEFTRYRERIVEYMQKATKEAKVHTSWVNPNDQYDKAVQDFVRSVLPDDRDDPFVGDLLALHRRVAFHGRFNALSQVLLKLTAPGVPDFYQGTELWDYSLVDPDNRRPVDYQLRRPLLAELKNHVARHEHELTALARELLDDAPDGRIKMYLIYRTLNFRRTHRQLFDTGGYLPLQAKGEKQDHVCAFGRTKGSKEILVVVPRLTVGLVGGIEQPPVGLEVWNDTRLVLRPEQRGQRFRNIFTGEVLSASEKEGIWVLPLAEACAHFPVALLELQPE